MPDHPMKRFETPLGWTPEHDLDQEGGEFAASHDPALELGVDYVGPYEGSSGVEEAVRRHAVALDGDGKMPVFLTTSGGVGMRYADIDPAVRAKIDKLTTCRYKAPLLRIVHTVLGTSTIQNAVYPTRAVGISKDELERLQKTTIIMTVFERLTPDPGLQDACKLMNKVAQVWVPCRRNMEVLIASGMNPDKVHVVPHPYDPTELPLFKKYGENRPKKPLPIRFLNVGKWEPRKGQHELIGAFLREFRPGEPVQLILKTSAFGKWKDYPTGPIDSVKLWLADEKVKTNGWTFENVQRFILPYLDKLPRDMLIAMHAQASVYVSAGRAEGFDLSAFDAKIAGRRIVYVPSGGPEDFATSTDIMVPFDEVAPCHEGYNWIGARWSGYKIDSLSASMRAAFDLERTGAKNDQFDVAPYDPDVVGAKMRSLVKSVTDKIASGEA